MTTNQSRFVKKQSSAPLSRGSIILLVVFAVLAIATAVTAFIIIRNLVSNWSMTDLPGAPVGSEGAEAPGSQATIDPSIPLQPVEGPAAKPWDGKTRVNVLIMGLDYRDYVAGDVPRTDTMILFTLDPVTKKAGMLSIPRDMWVNIPGFDYGKINTAYFLGESYKMPGGGPGMAIEAVQAFLGVPVHFYAQIDFAAFVRFIDEIGGVKIAVAEDMKIGIYGTNKDEYLKGGETYTLNGDLALAYARARYTEGGDVDRAGRQQQVIMAMRDRILDLNQMPALLTKAPKLYQDLSSGIRTNLSLDQALQLGKLALEIDVNNIQKAVIGYDETIMDMVDGQSVLIPIPDKIRLIRDSIFTSGGAVSPAAMGTSDPLALAKEEKARVLILNGTATPGLASRTNSYLTGQGLQVVGENNADQVYANTVLRIYGPKPYTLSFLATQMGVPSARIQYFDPDPSIPADIVVILGNDWEQQNPMP